MARIIHSKDFIAKKAWDSLDIANMKGITTRLHWTDQAYHWHINTGEEVFVVLDGVVDMHYKIGSKVIISTLKAADIFYATTGTEHVAHPQGEARVLVIESEDSE